MRVSKLEEALVGFEEQDEIEAPVWEYAIQKDVDLASGSYEEHVDYAANLMRCGNWGPGSLAVLSRLYCKPRAYLTKVAGEAGRRVASDAVDRDKVQVTVSQALAVNLHKAMKAGKFADVAKTADVWTRIVGARAPERHEHAVIVAHYDAMSPRNKIRWIDDRIKKLQEKREELLSVAGDENDAFEPSE